LCRIDGEAYLLPYGQSATDYRKGVHLNETGATMWSLLKTAKDEEELIQSLCDHYQVSETQIPQLRVDTTQFLTQLRGFSILPPIEEKKQHHTDKVMLQIGELLIVLYDAAPFIGAELATFRVECKDSEPRYSAALEVTFHAVRPPDTINGRAVVRNRNLIVLSAREMFVLLFPSSAGLAECRLYRDGKKAEFYYRTSIGEQLKSDVFYALRIVYCMMAQRKGLFAFHSASILYKGKAWLIAARAGTGKTTHATHWHKLYQTPLINGDMNLIGQEGGQYWSYGIPWCGTSGVYSKEKYPLGGIVLLRRGEQDKVTECPLHEKALLLSQRSISPDWTKEMAQRNVRFAQKTAESIPILSFSCTKEESAAMVLKEKIDQYT
jgi:hypothetical protein